MIFVIALILIVVGIVLYLAFDINSSTLWSMAIMFGSFGYGGFHVVKKVEKKSFFSLRVRAK